MLLAVVRNLLQSKIFYCLPGILGSMQQHSEIQFIRGVENMHSIDLLKLAQSSIQKCLRLNFG